MLTDCIATARVACSAGAQERATMRTVMQFSCREAIFMQRSIKKAEL